MVDTMFARGQASEGPGQVHFESARSLELRGDYKNALAAYLKAASAGEQWPYCLYVARIYLRLNEPGAAEAASPQTAPSWRRIAWQHSSRWPMCWARRGNTLDQKEIAERIIESDPQNAEAWYVSGRNRLAIHDETQGEARLRKAIELNSELAHAHLALGTHYSQEKSTFEQGRRSLERAQALGLGNFQAPPGAGSPSPETEPDQYGSPASGKGCRTKPVGSGGLLSSQPRLQEVRCLQRVQ